MAGIERTVDNSAAYLQSWARALKADHKLLVGAASAAQKAADLILSFSASPAEGEAPAEPAEPEPADALAEVA